MSLREFMKNKICPFCLNDLEIFNSVSSTKEYPGRVTDKYVEFNSTTRFTQVQDNIIVSLDSEKINQFVELDNSGNNRHLYAIKEETELFFEPLVIEEGKIKWTDKTREIALMSAKSSFLRDVKSYGGLVFIHRCSNSNCRFEEFSTKVQVNSDFTKLTGDLKISGKSYYFNYNGDEYFIVQSIGQDPKRFKGTHISRCGEQVWDSEVLYSLPNEFPPIAKFYKQMKGKLIYF